MERIQKKWREIREEAINVKELPIHTTSPDFGKNWDTVSDETIQQLGWLQSSYVSTYRKYALIYQNNEVKNNIDRCPVTKKLLRKLQKKYDIFIAGYAIMRGKSVTPVHTDNNEDYTPWHLGLEIPNSEDCALVVEAEENEDGVKNHIYHEEEGKYITFDDHQRHFAYNKTDKDRIILYLLIRSL